MNNDSIFLTPKSEEHLEFEILVFNVDHINLNLPKKFKVIDTAQSADIFLFNNGFNFLFDRTTTFDHSLLMDDKINSTIKFYRYQKRKSNFSKLIKNSSKLIASELETEYFEIFQELMHIPSTSTYEFLLAAQRISSIKSLFNLTLLTLEESMSVDLFEDYLYIDGEYVLLLKLKSSNIYNGAINNQAQFFITGINEILNNNFKDQILNKTSENIQKHSATHDSLTFNDLSLILSKLDFPIAVINNESLVIANDLFLKLGVLPSKLSGKSSKEWIEIDEVFYQIKKSSIFEIGEIYIFTRVEKRKDKVLDHQSDLGIITGSIAHELNNPVAGILAAITLLELDEWDPENHQVLNDLKESASRSKSLIETFLSISRHNKKKGEERLISQEIEKALSLLRYRIIESGINLNVEQEHNLESVRSQLIVLPIVLYLIYGELLTIFSHKRLIDSNLPKNLCLDMSFVNKALIIKIKPFELTKEDEKKFHLKLIEHLMEMDSIKLKITKKTIELLLN